jgi:flavin-dependent dehydrogenase
VDRARFEQRLRERAAELGVSSIGPQGAGARAGDRWVFGGSERSARYVVDASGRAAVFARGLGVRREVAWEQAALVGFARANRPIEEAYTLVEAVEAGFWYTAPTPGGRFVVALFTDAKLHAGRGGDATATLSRLLADAPHTRARLEAHGAVLEGAPRFVDAGSARLATAQGAGWIAVGDAALAYDPVSAHGLTLALRTGIDAAAALLADAAGDTGRTGALLRYQARLDGAFASHCAEALRIYGSEPRWTNAPYWRRRRELGRAT